jgi:hypothetical protein
MDTKKVTVTLAVEVELTSEGMTPEQAAAHLKSRLTAFLYPVGMEVQGVVVAKVVAATR